MGLRALFSKERDFEVVGEVVEFRDVPAAVTHLSPDVVVMDAHASSLEAVEVIHRLTGNTTGERPKVMALINELDDSIQWWQGAGAQVVLPCQATPEQIVASVRMVAAGYVLLDQSTVIQPTEPLTASTIRADTFECSGKEATPDALTRRERDVLGLIARGYTNAEISETLFLSESTVKSHVQRMLSKLELRNRVHAVIYAYEKGIIPIGGNQEVLAGILS